MSPFQHSPFDYDCPFCKIVSGEGSQHTSEQDVILRDEHVTAFLALKNWPNNRGHVLVIPNEHFENVYELPDELGTPIQSAIRRIAIAMKLSYGCSGVSTRQHNEPDGNQDVWHYHVHVYPRYKGDMLYLTAGKRTTPVERRPYAEKLRTALRNIDHNR